MAASRLFNAKGVDTTSLDEIAEQVGTNKRMLYRYVGDKQAIVAACFDRAFRFVFFTIDQAKSLGLSAAQSLVATERANGLVLQSKALSPLSALIPFDALSEEARASVQGLSRRLSAISRERFAEAQRAGDMRVIDLDELLHVSPGPIIWLVKSFIESDERRQVMIADEIAEFTRVGIAAL